MPDVMRLDGPLGKGGKVEIFITGPFGSSELDRLKEWVDLMFNWAEFHIVEEPGTETTAKETDNATH